MGFILWLAAVILIIVAVVTLIHGSVIRGIVQIIVGSAIGPGDGRSSTAAARSQEPRGRGRAVYRTRS